MLRLASQSCIWLPGLGQVMRCNNESEREAVFKLGEQPPGSEVWQVDLTGFWPTSPEWPITCVSHLQNPTGIISRPERRMSSLGGQNDEQILVANFAEF